MTLIPFFAALANFALPLDVSAATKWVVVEVTESAYT